MFCDAYGVMTEVRTQDARVWFSIAYPTHHHSFAAVPSSFFSAHIVSSRLVMSCAACGLRNRDRGWVGGGGTTKVIQPLRYTARCRCSFVVYFTTVAPRRARLDAEGSDA